MLGRAALLLLFEAAAHFAAAAGRAGAARRGGAARGNRLSRLAPLPLVSDGFYFYRTSFGDLTVHSALHTSTLASRDAAGRDTLIFLHNTGRQICHWSRCMSSLQAPRISCPLDSHGDNLST